MSDTPQGPDAGTQEGGYGYPTLEQEVTPEVLEAGAAADGSGDAVHNGTPSAEDGDDGDDGDDGEDGDDAPTPGELEEDPPTPGELVEDPPATEPTD